MVLPTHVTLTPSLVGAAGALPVTGSRIAAIIGLVALALGLWLWWRR